MNTKLIIPFLILALLAGGVMLGCNDDNSPTAALPDYRPPSVEWIAPSPDADLSGETTLLIAASDDDEVANVAVYLNGQSPDDWRVAGHADTLYSFTWDTRDYSDAYYNLEARAWDASGNLGISPALLVRVANDTTVQPEEDNIAPDVWWTDPDPGNVRGEVELTFRVLDDNPLQRVRIYQNGVMPEGGDIVVNDEGIYSLIWNTLEDSDGVYSWEARAWDEAGNLGISPALLVRVANDTTAQPDEDRTPPLIAWMSPEPGDTVQSVVNLRFQIIDDSPIDTVIVMVNGQQWQKLVNLDRFCNGDVIWNTSEFDDGIYLIQIKAMDSARNVAYSEVIRFTVWNSRPRVIWVPDDFETIQGAINFSSDFDTIRVRPGTYREGPRITKRIWLESETGPENTVIDAAGWGFGVAVSTIRDTINSAIRGFTIINSDMDGIFLSEGGSVRIMNNIILSSERAGIFIYDGYISSSIVNNVIVNGGPPFHIYISTSNISNNIVLNAGGSAFYNGYIYDNPVTPDYNLAYNYARITNDPPILFGEHNIFGSDPLFINDSYRLSDNSPCIDSGNPELHDIDGSRSDMGVYGGPYSY